MSQKVEEFHTFVDPPPRTHTHKHTHTHTHTHTQANTHNETTLQGPKYEFCTGVCVALCQLFHVSLQINLNFPVFLIEKFGGKYWISYFSTFSS